MNIKDRIKAWGAAVGSPKNEEAKEETKARFAVGDLVLLKGVLDTAVLVEIAWTEKKSGTHWYAVHARVLPPQHGIRMHLPNGLPEIKRGRWVKEEELESYTVVPSEFKLLELPKPALACVFKHVGWAQGAEMAPMCRKFADAFNDGSTWRDLCFKDMEGTKEVWF